MRRVVARLLAAVFVVFLSGSAAAAAEPVEPFRYGYRLLETYPHASDAFTQGLFFDDGALYETTGQYGESSLRRVDLETGEVLQKTALPQSLFGEGAAMALGDIFVLSWKNGIAFRFDPENFTLEKSYSYEGEGWGLAFTGEELVMSDGGAQLRFIDPLTFEETRRLRVTLRGQPLHNLNELEWVDGEIFANVWKTDAIVRIDPSSGAVTGIIDLRGLLPDEDHEQGKTDVLNGIAYKGEKDVLYVTGKYWPKLFKIEIFEMLN